MRRQNIELKKAILNRMDEKDYNTLVRIMADDIYNKVEYDVIILLARKCSSLYNAMIPLVREERDGLVEETHRQLIEKQGGREPIVLTDCALDWVIWSIRQDAKREPAGIRKVLLVDDIIIHGRTLLRTRDKLKQEFGEAGIEDYKIDITTFAANTEELLIDEKEICNLPDIRRCTISSWKPFSGQIVDIIYLSGQTYTSYVPKFRFPMDSEAGNAIRHFIARECLPQITDPAREGLGVKIYACVEKGREQYKLCESYRIYEFSNQSEYVFVPMVSLRPVDEECLNEYIESMLALGIIIRNKGQEQDSLKEFLSNCSGEYKYRLVVYAISVFAGWQLLQERIGVKEEQDYECYDRKVEAFNFYFSGLKGCNQMHESRNSLSDFSKKLEENYCAMVPFKELNENGNIADAIQDADVKKLADSFACIIEASKEKRVDNDVVGKLLTVNNSIDEKRYRDSVKKEEKNIQDRVMGIPLIDIVNMLMYKGSMTLAKAFMFVLMAIDYGRASIVAHCFTMQTGKRWYTSLVHAGEENYRYYITHYLPILYGLSMLEFRSSKSLDADEKKKYWEKFYEENPDMKYLEADKDYLMQQRTLQELKDVVEDAALYQPMRQAEKEALNNAIKTIIMSAKDCEIILNLFRLGENVIKRGCTDCMRQPNKAICIGEEQAFLLKMIITDNLQWDIRDRKIHIIDQEFLDSSLRCSQRSILPVLWNEELLQQGNKADTDVESEKAEGETEEDAIKHYIYNQLGNFKHWDKVCEPIVLALAVNSCYKVVDRDTLTHLCMNSKYGPVLFRKIIMRIMSLLAANWFEHEKLEEIAAFFINFGSITKLMGFRIPHIVHPTHVYEF